MRRRCNFDTCLKEKLWAGVYTLLMILSIQALYSQELNQIGIKYGMTVSDLDWVFMDDSNIFGGQDLGRQKGKGFFTMVSYEYLNYKYWNISSGFGFYQKESLQTEINYGFFSKWNLDYLTLDTQLKLKYPFKKVIPYLIFGPRIDYLVKWSSDFDKYQANADTRINKTNTGLRYGGGIAYNLGISSINIGWSNNFNFNNILKSEEGNPSIFSATIKDRTMVFYAALLINLTKPKD